MLAVGTAVGEEVLFRGVLLRVLNAWFGSSVAVAMLSLLFGLAHVGNAGRGSSAPSPSRSAQAYC